MVGLGSLNTLLKIILYWNGAPNLGCSSQGPSISSLPDSFLSLVSFCLYKERAMYQWSDKKKTPWWKLSQVGKRWTNLAFFLEVPSLPLFPVIVASIQFTETESFPACVFSTLFLSVPWSMDMWLSDRSLEKRDRLFAY